MEKIFIADLIDGQKIISHFAIVDKKVLPFKDPSKGEYLALTLGDRTGQISGRQWNPTYEAIHNLRVGAIVRIEANVEEYRGDLQLNVTAIDKLAEDKIDYSDYLALAPRPIEEMLAEFWELIKSVEDTNIRLFLEDFFNDEEMLKSYTMSPAASRVHHNYLGGLLEHSLEVASLVKMMAKLYPEADESLLIAGAIFHDLGKIKEYAYDSLIYTSDQGRLLGHIGMGFEMITAKAKENKLLDPEQELHLGHLILSHHGELTMGSPVLPQTLEAFILHQADLMSGRVKQVQQVLEGSTKEAWTNYDRLLGRYLYRGFEETDRN